MTTQNKLINIAGTLLSITAFWFIGSKILANWSMITSWPHQIPFLWVVFVAACAYATASFSLSFAWNLLLRFLGQSELDARLWHSIYARTQIAKYIPGNIFHFAGRHVLGKKAGISHTVMVGATILEALGLVTAACAVSLIGFVSGSQEPNGTALWYLWGLLTALSLPLLIIIALKYIRPLQMLNLSTRPFTKLLKPLFCAYFFYTLFFLVSGGILLWLVGLVGEIQGPKMSGIVFSAYAASWIGGYVTPGSPAGLGVRESLIVMLLNGIIVEPLSLLVALTFRCITITGDLIYFFTSYITIRKIKSKISPNNNLETE